MSDTPRTDEFKIGTASAAETGGVSIRHHTNNEWALFARQLERELNMMKVHIEAHCLEKQILRNARDEWKKCAEELARELAIFSNQTARALGTFNQLNK